MNQATHGRKGLRLASLLGGLARVRHLLLFGCLLVASTAQAAGGPPATKLVQVIDTRRMDDGVTRWVADLYNDNLWLYGLVVVVVMALIGLALGLIFDRLVGLLGINLGKLDHHE
ncbi:MAG: hypothetical protein HY905_27610 [Deltaproteobacteria bacterium]|nr:hypothetical protein [Deltaproteobacteria bacterium]